MRPRLQQDLGVAARAEAAARGFELSAQLAEIVDLAVVDDDVTAVRRSHRLSARGREVDDGEPAMRKSETILDIDVLAVGTPMRQRRDHLLQDGRTGRL